VLRCGCLQQRAPDVACTPPDDRVRKPRLQPPLLRALSQHAYCRSGASLAPSHVTSPHCVPHFSSLSTFPTTFPGLPRSRRRTNHRSSSRCRATRFSGGEVGYRGTAPSAQRRAAARCATAASNTATARPTATAASAPPRPRPTSPTSHPVPTGHSSLPLLPACAHSSPPLRMPWPSPSSSDGFCCWFRLPQHRSAAACRNNWHAIRRADAPAAARRRRRRRRRRRLCNSHVCDARRRATSVCPHVHAPHASSSNHGERCGRPYVFLSMDISSGGSGQCVGGPAAEPAISSSYASPRGQEDSPAPHPPTYTLPVATPTHVYSRRLLHLRI